jgi:hypothetical protein
MADPYKVLGVSPTASLQDCRAAFKRLAMIYHPDRFSTSDYKVREEAEVKMRELNAAFAEVVQRRNGAPDPAEILSSQKWLAEWWQAREDARLEEEKRAVLFARWDKVEEARRQREEAERESISAVWRSVYGEPEKPVTPEGPRPALPAPSGSTSKSFHERLREAKESKQQVPPEPEPSAKKKPAPRPRAARSAASS